MRPLKIDLGTDAATGTFALRLVIEDFPTREEAQRFADAMVHWIKDNTEPETTIQRVQ